MGGGHIHVCVYVSLLLLYVAPVAELALCSSSTHHLIINPSSQQCYGVLEDETHYMIVMELCERGSLMDLLKQARDQPEVAEKLSWPVRLDIAHRIASGMALIHAESVLHRDLKSPNVW